MSHLGPARRPRTTANRSAPSPAHPLTAGRTLTGVPQLRDAGRPGCSSQACPRRRRREAAGMRAAFRTGRHECSDLHRHLETRLHPRYGESAVQVSSQCDVLTNEFSTLKLAARQMPSRNSAPCRLFSGSASASVLVREVHIIRFCASSESGPWVRQPVRNAAAHGPLPGQCPAPPGGGRAARVLRVVGRERQMSLAASLGCWHAYSVGRLRCAYPGTGMLTLMLRSADGATSGLRHGR
jgi:hypothetical protein